MKLKEIYKDKEIMTYYSIIFSLIATLLFALYNGILGIIESSIWNGSICVYFILLTIIRLIIFLTEKKIKNKQIIAKNMVRYKMFVAVSILLLLLNLAMITPVSLMVLNQKEVNFGMIPAIVLAVYTTYKIISASIMYTKNRSNDNLSFRQLRLINLIDAIISVLTLQNALIAVNGSMEHSMFLLSCISSAVAIVFIVVVVCISFRKGVKDYKNIYKNEKLVI